MMDWNFFGVGSLEDFGVVNINIGVSEGQQSQLLNLHAMQLNGQHQTWKMEKGIPDRGIMF